jgi:hypothetical protein
LDLHKIRNGRGRRLVSDARGGKSGGREQTLTLADSYNLYVFMSTISPVSPLIPHECSPFACFA